MILYCYNIVILIDIIKYNYQFVLQTDKKPRKEWPDRGKIIFQQFFLRYSPDSTHILKNLNIRIQPMEKVIINPSLYFKQSLIIVF